MPQHHQKRWGAPRSAASGYTNSRDNKRTNHQAPSSGTSGAGRGSYYGPQPTGQGRGSGPRNPGHAAAIASRQPPRGNTPLQALTGIRSGGGDESNHQSGIHGTTNYEMQKTIPTESMERTLVRLQQKDIQQLTLEDFNTQDLNDGRSILLTLLVNSIIELRPELGEAQRARIAAHAAVHHPTYLHEALFDMDVALELAASFLATRPVKLEINGLCPMDTPYLIEDTKLREYLGQLTMTPTSELRRIITPFLQCFYPSDWELLEQIVRKVSGNILQDFISTPGAMHAYFKAMDQSCTFAPPQWLSLSALQTEGEKPPPEKVGQRDDDDDEDDDSVDSEDLLHPLREMRIDQMEFNALEPEVQKKKILAVFPTRMASVLPADVFGYMIVMLSEMSANSIQGAMDPRVFQRLTKHAKTTATKAAELTPAPQLYYYRFRVQHLGTGYPSWANKSGSTILRSWIQAWIPLFTASRYTLALIKNPSQRHLHAINLAAPSDIPTPQVLEPYVYDVVRTRQGHIHQLDFWILTECPDINNNGAQSFTRSKSTTAAYQEVVRKAAIWSMKMEKIPQGYVPCIFLGNSLLKDDERLVKEEIILRTGFLPKYQDKFQVEWNTISTKSGQAQTMAHCILAKPEDHQLVSTLCTSLNPIQDVEFPVTAEYQPLIIPLRCGPDEDQELSQAIARHQEYTRGLTQVSIRSLPRTSMCHYIPLDSGMEGIPPQHTASIAYLVLNGKVITDDGTTIPSPVTRVNMDSKRTRLLMHAPKNLAGQLILYARGIYRLLTKWYEDDISQATLDTRDADKIALDRDNNNGSAQQPLNNMGSIIDDTGIQVSTTISSTTSPTAPPLQQQMVSVPQDQWNRAVQLLIASAEKMDKILSHMEKMPTIITHKDALDEAVSVITQSLTLNSDLINNRADQTILDTRRTLAERITVVDDHVAQMGTTMESRHDQIALSMSQVFQRVGDIMSKADRVDLTTRGQAMDEGDRDEEQKEGNTDDLQGTKAVVDTRVRDSETEGNVSRDTPTPKTTAMSNTDTRRQSETQSENTDHAADLGGEVRPADNSEQQVDTEEMKTSQEDSEVDFGGELTEPEEDWETKYASESDTERETTPTYAPIARCHACNKLDAGIAVCDHCEIPHHLDCLIKDPDGGSNRYCNECIKLLHGEDQKPTSQPNIHSDFELSEPESTTSGGSGDTEFRPTARMPVAKTPIADDTSQPQNTASKYSLRDRKKIK